MTSSKTEEIPTRTPDDPPLASPCTRTKLVHQVQCTSLNYATDAAVRSLRNRRRDWSAFNERSKAPVYCRSALPKFWKLCVDASDAKTLNIQLHFRSRFGRRSNKSTSRLIPAIGTERIATRIYICIYNNNNIIFICINRSNALTITDKRSEQTR